MVIKKSLICFIDEKMKEANLDTYVHRCMAEYEPDYDDDDKYKHDDEEDEEYS